jgi:hypothetical protein
MERGRVIETEPMPRLVGGNTEMAGGMLKSGNRFLKPNFERGPNDGVGYLIVFRVELVTATCAGRMELRNGHK